MAPASHTSNALESIAGYARLELFGAGVEPIAVIENKPDSAASLQIYYHVSLRWGGIGPAAAARALQLYGELAEEAQRRPGKYPDIDRLYQIIRQDEYYSVRCYPKEGP